MLSYRFIFDSEPPTFKVKGWEDVELKAVFDKQSFIITATGEITVFDEVIFDYIESRAVNDVINLEIQFKSFATPNWSTLKTLSVPVIELEKDCKLNAWKISFEGQTILDKMKGKEREKVRNSLSGVAAATLHQPWSGGELSLSNGKFLDVFSILESIIQYFAPTGSINSNIIGSGAPSYRPEIWEISNIAALGDGDTATLNILTEFGDTFRVNVVGQAGGYTGAELAQVLANGLLHVRGVSSGNGPSLLMDSNELCGRPNDAVASSNTLTMTFDYRISVMSLVESGSSIGDIAILQGFQYSLKNLKLGSLGKNNLEISFGELRELLQVIAPLVVEDGDTSLTVTPFAALNTAFPSLLASNRFATKSFNKDFKEENIIIGHDYSFDDYESLQGAWQWVGADTDISSSVAGNSWTYVYAGATGPKRINGFVELQNTSARFRTAYIEVLLNGTYIGRSDTEEIPPNSPHGIVANIVSWIEVPEFCLQAGDTLTEVV